MAQAAPPARKERPRTRPGRPFQKGNPGKKKGTRYVRTLVGIEVARALAGQASDRLAKLIDSKSGRIAFEASRLVLAYAWGAPRQTLELTGDFGDLSRELTAALQEARVRRAALDAPLSVVALSAAPDALPAFSAAEGVTGATDSVPASSVPTILNYPKLEAPE
jgi:hypothetical protein